MWREIGPLGRSWVAEWSPGQGSLRTVEFSPASEIHQRQSVGELSLPLALMEVCRSDQIGPEGLSWLNPTEAGVTPARLVRHEELPHDLPSWAFDEATRKALRLVQVVSLDGALLTSYLFQGETLMGVQWGAGSPWALPMDEAQWWADKKAWFARKRKRQSGPKPDQER